MKRGAAAEGHIHGGCNVQRRHAYALADQSVGAVQILQYPSLMGVAEPCVVVGDLRIPQHHIAVDAASDRGDAVGIYLVVTAFRCDDKSGGHMRTPSRVASSSLNAP